MQEKLISEVIKQIEEDIKDNSFLALYDLLNCIPKDNLIIYLLEENQKKFNN